MRPPSREIMGVPTAHTPAPFAHGRAEAVALVVAHRAVDAFAYFVPLLARRVLAIQVQALLALASGVSAARYARPIAVQPWGTREPTSMLMRNIWPAPWQFSRNTMCGSGIGCAERDRGGQRVGELLHERPRDVPHVRVPR